MELTVEPDLLTQYSSLADEGRQADEEGQAWLLDAADEAERSVVFGYANRHSASGIDGGRHGTPTLATSGVPISMPQAAASPSIVGLETARDAISLLLGLDAAPVAPSNLLVSTALESRESRVYGLLSRMLDILGSASLLLLLSPLLIGVAVGIRLTSPGPALFRQTRVGRNGELFCCYKFRTMVNDADHLKQEMTKENQHDDQRTFKMRRDPRITWLGALLRKSSIDEMPQLWNVLRGEMSLVGPRPAVPSEVELYQPEDHRRLHVKPGLTCIWQVSGRSNLPFDKQVEMDIKYIENRSLWLDLKLLALTLPAVVFCRGAY